MFSLLIKLVGLAVVGIVVFAFIAAKTENPLLVNMFPLTTSEAGTASFDGKISNGIQSKATLIFSNSGTVPTMKFNESELSSKLTSLENSGYGVDKGWQVHLTGGVRLLHKVSILGAEVSLGVLAKPVVTDGQLHFKVVEVRAGSFEVTQFLAGQSEAALDLLAKPISAAFPGTLATATADAGSLTLTGK